MNKAAQALGRLGGKSTSEAKRRAARANWRKAAAALKAKRKAANSGPDDRCCGDRAYEDSCAAQCGF